MKYLKIIIPILIVGILALVYFSGILDKAVVHEGEAGGLIIAGKSYVGPYESVGPLYEEIYETFKENGLDSDEALGIYYDDPNKVDKDALRSFHSIVIPKDHYHDLDKWKELGMTVDTIQRTKALIIDFPFRSMLSFMTGASKAYPSFEAYIAGNNIEEKYNIVEVYEHYQGTEKIQYVMQIQEK